MESNAELTDKAQRGLFDVAEPIYRAAISDPFDLTLADGWDVLEEDGGDRLVLYISVRIDLPDDRHWFTRFKFPDVLETPEQWFQNDADKMKQAMSM